MTLNARLDALREVRALGGDRLPAPQAAAIEALLERADRRRALSADHTVVGLFGATGSGKSSLLNALVGETIATAHVRRPTTSEPLAVTWNPSGAAALLDWLEVHDRHPREAPIDARATSLILLDLPDFDSVEASHRAIAERLAGQVDALVWVVDPQKYADAVLHTDFIATHARHGAVTIVVLNQADLLPEADVPRVVASLRQLLADDGLVGVRVLTTSARTGAGVAELRSAIGDLAAARAAQTERLTADVASLAGAIEHPGSPSKPAKADARALAGHLADAAGAGTVARAVAGSYRKRAGQATGWPIVSWMLRLRADPLGRLGLRPAKGEARDPELHRTSMPPMSTAQRARASLAVREYADAAAAGLTEPWRLGVRQVAERALDALPDRLDLAVSRAALPTRGSWWWVLFGILQWVSVLAALAGVGWLLVIAFLPPIGALIPVPVIEGWPLTTLLIAGGVLLGIALGLASAGISAAVAAHRRRRASRAVLAQVREVADELVVAPVAAELERARAFAGALALARG